MPLLLADWSLCTLYVRVYLPEGRIYIPGIFYGKPEGKEQGSVSMAGIWKI